MRATSSLARFPNDREAHVETEYQWSKLIDKRRRKGWEKVDPGALDTKLGHLGPELKAKRRKPLLEI